MISRVPLKCLRLQLSTGNKNRSALRKMGGAVKAVMHAFLFMFNRVLYYLSKTVIFHIKCIQSKLIWISHIPLLYHFPFIIPHSSFFVSLGSISLLIPTPCLHKMIYTRAVDLCIYENPLTNSPVHPPNNPLYTHVRTIAQSLTPTFKMTK